MCYPIPPVVRPPPSSEEIMNEKRKPSNVYRLRTQIPGLNGKVFNNKRIAKSCVVA